MIPEASGHSVVNVLVSVVMSHMLLFQVLEWFELEVTSEMEPEMHRVVENLSKHETTVESDGGNESEKVKLNDSCANDYLRDMP